MDNLTKLRYWTFKILPLVYDDSLSYYEVLTKVTAKINELIDSNNSMPQAITTEVKKQLSSDELATQIMNGLVHAIATDEETKTFTTNAKSGGELIFLDGNLYKVVAVMPAGTNYIVGTNIVPVNIYKELKDIKEKYLSSNNEHWNDRSANNYGTGAYLYWKDVLYATTKDIKVNDILYNEGDNQNLKQITLADEITNLQNNIDAEATARQTADNTLQGNIMNAVQASVTNEKNERVNADDSLSNRISQADARISNLVGNTGNSNSEIVDARTANNKKIFKSIGDHVRNIESNITGSSGVSYRVEKGKTVNGENGLIADSSSYDLISIDVVPGTIISGFTRGGYNITNGAAFFDTTGKYISGGYNKGTTDYDWDFQFMVPKDASVFKIVCSSLDSFVVDIRDLFSGVLSVKSNILDNSNNIDSIKEKQNNEEIIISKLEAESKRVSDAFNYKWNPITEYEDDVGYWWTDRGTKDASPLCIAAKVNTTYAHKYRISAWTNYDGIWSIRLLKRDGSIEKLTDYSTVQPISNYVVSPSIDTVALLITHHASFPDITIEESEYTIESDDSIQKTVDSIQKNVDSIQKTVESISKDTDRKIYYCGPTRELSTLKEGIEKAESGMDCTLYVDPGTYNLIEEFGDAYFNSLTFANTLSGIRLKNRIHIIFSPNSKVVCNYKGDNKYARSLFSPFNADEYGFILENLTLECSNVRYAIHDERNGSTEQYKAHYINCNISIDNNNNPDWHNQAPIGGGLGSNSEILVKNCIFKTGNSDNRGGVYYHQSNDESNTDYGSKVVIKDNYFESGCIQIDDSRTDSTSKVKTEYLISNNSFARKYDGTNDEGIFVINATNPNSDIYCWNNEIRSA